MRVKVGLSGSSSGSSSRSADRKRVSCNAKGIGNVVAAAAAAAKPFQFETVSTIKEINYFRYVAIGMSSGGARSAGPEPRRRPGKCAHTSAGAE